MAVLVSTNKGIFSAISVKSCVICCGCVGYTYCIYEVMNNLSIAKAQCMQKREIYEKDKTTLQLHSLNILLLDLNPVSISSLYFRIIFLFYLLPTENDHITARSSIRQLTTNDYQTSRESNALAK